MNEYSQMVADLAKPGEDIIATLTPIKTHTLHMAVGLAGEAGELLEHFCIDPLHISTDEGTLDSLVIEELGDAEFYFEGLCQSMRVTLDLTGTTSNNPLCIPRYVVAATDILDLVKKMVVYNKDIDLGIFVNALTKVRVCLDQAYSYYNITQQEALAHNVNKLLKGKNARYKEGEYSDEAAQLRRDKEIKYSIGEADGEGGYGMWAGPLTDLESLKEQYDGKSENSYIISFANNKKAIIARWDTLLEQWRDKEPQS